MGQLGHERHADGDVAGALAAYSQAIAAGDGAARVHHANALFAAGRRDEAIVELRSAVNDGIPSAHTLLAVVREENGDLDEAERNLGTLYADEERIEDAERHWQLGAHSGDPFAAANLGRHLLAEGGREEEGCQLVRQASAAGYPVLDWAADEEEAQRLRQALRPDRDLH